MTEFELSGEVELFGQRLTMSYETGGDEAASLTIEVADPPSLAVIVETLAGLAVPGFRLRLPPPWDALARATPEPFRVAISDETIELRIDGWPGSIVDGVLDVTSVGLVYDRIGDRLDVDLAINLLGRELTTVWDPIEEPVPPVDSGDRPFELTYLGLGQHQALNGEEQPETLPDVVDRLMAEPDLRFEAQAGWLFATRFSAMETVDLDLVLWDPFFYGLAVNLRGDRAGPLAGFRFEILYRRISDDLGLYHAEVDLPTTLRRLELGAVSATLPGATIDVYTDGSFLVDLGFPRDLDFSRSLAIEVFPFVGRGGFAVGLLPAETVPGLPPVPSGARFEPVLAVAVGLDVGVGKNIEMGPLSAGATVTMVAVFDGVFAPYLDPAGDPAGLYYRVTAQVGLIGRIHATVDFGIIQAQLDIVATSIATLTIESHRPTLVVLEASVDVDLEVRVLFITLSFSFAARVRAEFTIGSATTAPWELPAPARLGPRAAALSGGSRGSAFTLAPPRRPVVTERVTILLRMTPQVTVGWDEDGVASIELVTLLMVDATEPDEGPSNWARLVDACFAWAADIMDDGSNDDGRLDRGELERLQHQLGRFFSGDESDQALTPEAVLDFWAQNFDYRVSRWPNDIGPDTPHVLFPMNPAYRLEIDDDGDVIHQVDFGTDKPCPPSYRRQLAAWFDQLRIVAEAESAPDPHRALSPSAVEGGDPTLAELVMVDYCRTILRVTIADAIAAIDAYPHAAQPGDTLGGLAEHFGLDPVLDMALPQPAELDGSGPDEPATALRAPLVIAVPAGAVRPLPDSPHPLDSLARSLADDHGVTIEIEALVRANLDRPGLLVAGAEITWPIAETEPASALTQPVTHEVRQQETLRSLAARLRPPSVVTPDAQLLIEVLAAYPRLLQPAAELGLPALPGFRPDPGQSLSAVADSLALDPVELLGHNRDVEITGTVHLLGCESLSIDEVRRAFPQLGTFETAGAAVTRYSLHGLRLPDPDLGPIAVSGAPPVDGQAKEPATVPLHRLLGQQITVPDNRVETIAGWEYWLGNQGHSSPVRPQDPGPLQQAAAGYRALLAAGETGGQPGEEPAQEAGVLVDRLRQSILSFGPDRPYLVEPRRLALASPAIWTVPPTDQSAPSRFQLAPIPDSVRALLIDPAKLAVRAVDDPQALACRWITRVDVAIRGVADPTGSNRFAPGRYEMGVTDQRSQDLLLRVIDRLGPEDTLTLAWADPAGGLRSDDLDADGTILVRTNLSTFTRPPDQGPLRVGPALGDQPGIASLSDPARFLELVWQNSVIGQSGLYLDYRLRPDAPDSELDATIDPDGRGTLSLLIIWGVGADPVADAEWHHNAVAVPAGGAVAVPAGGAVAVPAKGGATRLTVAPVPVTTPTSEPITVSGAAAAAGLTVADLLRANATTPGLVAAGTTLTGPDGTTHTTSATDDLLLVALALDITLDGLAELLTSDEAASLPLRPGVEIEVHPRLVTRHPVMAPGTVSIRALRPAAVAGDPGTVDQLITTYNLVGFDIVANQRFAGSRAALPLGPQAMSDRRTTASDDDGPRPLTYRRTIPVDRLARSEDDGNPTRVADPYIGVGDELELAVHLVDLYGNRSPELRRVTLPIGYQDPLLPVDCWPGVECHYQIETDQVDRAELAVTIRIDPGRLIPATAIDPEQRTGRVAADRDRFAVAARQLADTRVGASLWSSLDPDATRPIDRGMLATVAADGRDWAMEVARIAPLEATTPARSQLLRQLASRHRVTVRQMATVNAINEELLRPGATLTIPGPGETDPHRVAEGDTLAAIAAQHGVTVEDLAEANGAEAITSPSARYQVPLHDSPPDDPRPRHWYTLSEGDSFTAVAEEIGVPVEALILANLTMDGLLVSRRTVDVPGQEGEEPLALRVLFRDTVATVAARAERERGRRIDAARLVLANDEARTVDGQAQGFRLRPGAMLLLPPAEVTQRVPFRVGTSDDVVPLTVELIVNRPVALVDRHFGDDPEVWRATTELEPAVARRSILTPPPATGPEADRLGDLARSLATAAPGWRLGRESVPQVADGRRDVPVAVRWEVPLSLEPVPCFYRPRPLSTQPWDGSVTVGHYENGTLTDPTSDLEPTRFTAVDLDAGIERFLAAVEMGLDPNVLVPLLTGSGREPFDALMAAKGRLAAALAERTSTILVHPDRPPGDAEVARQAAVEVVRQRLLARLDALADPGCVVDFRAAPTEGLGATRPTEAVRLFGVVVVGQGPDRRRLGEAKLSIGPEGHGGLTFELGSWDATHLAGSTESEPTVAWQPLNLEYDIATEPNGYQRSRWITFVEPPDPLDLGPLRLPLPHRRLPPAIEGLEDRIVIGNDDHGPLAALRRFEYELTHRRPPNPDDRVHYRLLTDPDPNPLIEPDVEPGIEPGPTEALRQGLAEVTTQFAVIEQPLLDDFRSGGDLAAAALGTLAQLATRLADLLDQPEPAAVPVGAGRPWGSDRFRRVDQDRNPVRLLGPPLDLLLTRSVTAMVTVVRNERLLDGHRTDPAFVLRSHSVRPLHPRQHTVRHATPVDAATFHTAGEPDPTLEGRLRLTLARLIGWAGPGRWPTGEDSLEVEIGAALEVGPTGLSLEAPIGVWPRRPLSDQVALDLAQVLWQHRGPDGTDRRWVLDIAFFAAGGGSTSAAAPLLHYLQVVVPVESVIGPGRGTVAP